MQQVTGAAARRRWSLSAAQSSSSQSPKVDPVVILIVHWVANSDAVHMTLQHGRTKPKILDDLQEAAQLKATAGPAQGATVGRSHLESKVVVLREGAQAHEGGCHRDACALHKLPQLGARIQAATAHVQHRLASLHAGHTVCWCAAG